MSIVEKIIKMDRAIRTEMEELSAQDCRRAL
jgi:hypothetical protein